MASSACRNLVGMDIDHLLPVDADPPPVAHQAHGPEQIPFNHGGVDTPDALLRADPVQRQVMLDGKGLSPLMGRMVSDTSNLLIRQLQHLYHRGDALVHLVREIQSGGLCFWVGLVEVSGCVPETLHFDFDERLAVVKR
jgi:hypothetical protein